MGPHQKTKSALEIRLGTRGAGPAVDITEYLHGCAQNPLSSPNGGGKAPSGRRIICLLTIGPVSSVAFAARGAFRQMDAVDPQAAELPECR
jgi:hypothetical protein